MENISRFQVWWSQYSLCMQHGYLHCGGLVMLSTSLGEHMQLLRC